MVKAVVKDIQTLGKLEVVKVPIDSIQPNAYNANRQSDKDFELLCRSIEEDGFTQPIIVQEGVNEIVDGEHRWRACKALGHEEVEVVFVNMSEAQRMIATLRHNRARGNENYALAAGVIQSLDRMGALDHAVDSLMLDQVELRVMLEDIPDIGENLRVEGEKLTVQDVKNQLAEEEARRKQQDAHDARSERAETDRMKTMSLKVTDIQKIQFNRALASLHEGNKGEKILQLIAMYGDQV